MKQVSIYSALGLSETASKQEVSHALRQMLRGQYKKTRDNFGALEDSLRFYNQASQILNDEDRRKLYDTEWELSNATPAQRIDFVLKEAAAGQLAAADGMVDMDETAAIKLATSLERVGQLKSPLSLELMPEGMGAPMPPRPPSMVSDAVAVPQPPMHKVEFQEATSNIGETEASLATADSVKGAAAPGHDTDVERAQGAMTVAPQGKMPAPPKVQHYHPILTEAIGQARSPIILGLSSGLTLLLIGALLYVTWGNLIAWSPTQSWIWGVLALLTLLLYGVGRRQGQKRREKEYALSAEPDEEAIKGWRRKRTIFFGSNFLSEDPSWVFQLRLSELERARIGRTSYPHPWNRVLARVFDYALWGWLLFFPLHEVARHSFLPVNVLSLIENPLLVPILVTLTWVPIEALLMAAVGTTLGKWLFGVYVQFRVSTPYAARSGGACWRYALCRAFRVWWQGAAMGIMPLAPIALGRGRAALERFDETDWDDNFDALVTHTPVGVLPRVVGSVGLVAMLAMYAVYWQAPVFNMIEETGRFTTQQIELWQGDLKKTAVSPSSTARQNQPVTPTDTSNAAATGTGKTAPSTTGAGTPAVDQGETESRRRLTEFREAIVNAREESLLLLDKHDWKRAYESCQRWARLEITNPAPMRCQGTALQAMGKHQEAINAFRSAKLYAPEDRSLDEAITRSQDEMFKALNR